MPLVNIRNRESTMESYLAESTSGIHMVSVIWHSRIWVSTTIRSSRASVIWHRISSWIHAGNCTGFILWFVCQTKLPVFDANLGIDTGLPCFLSLWLFHAERPMYISEWNHPDFLIDPMVHRTDPRTRNIHPADRCMDAVPILRIHTGRFPFWHLLLEAGQPVAYKKALIIDRFIRILAILIVLDSLCHSKIETDIFCSIVFSLLHDGIFCHPSHKMCDCWHNNSPFCLFGR